MSLTAVKAQGTARSQPTHGTHLEMVTSPTPALLCLHLFSRQAVAVWGKKKNNSGDNVGGSKGGVRQRDYKNR